MWLVFSIGFRIMTHFLSTCMLILIIARIFAPWPLSGSDAEDVTIAAATSVLTNWHPGDGTIFLSINHRDPSLRALQETQISSRGLRIRPATERDCKADECADWEKSSEFSQVDNFVSIDLLSIPLWRFGMVRAITSACVSEIGLVKGFSDWHVISFRSLCA
jgi:hypothetical protein